MEAIWEKLHDAATCASSAKVDVIELAEYFKTMLKCVSQDRTNVTRITNERLDILIELMKRYEEVVNIQVHGTALIWNLAAADETKKDYLRQTNKAAIDIIFGNLNCFKDVLALHDYAIGALWSLAAGSQPTTAEIVSRRGIELGKFFFSQQFLLFN